MITRPTYWTEWRVKRTLNRMLEELKEEQNLPRSKQTILIGELFERHDIPADNLSEWARGYDSVPEIRRSIKRLKSIFENRVNSGGLHNSLNILAVIFNLKNNYGWRDEQHIQDDRILESHNQLKEIRDRLAGDRRKNMIHGKRPDSGTA